MAKSKQLPGQLDLFDTIGITQQNDSRRKQMKEIYFINDYYVETTSWHNAVKSWLKYLGDATDIAFKAIDAMETFEDIFKMVNVFASEAIVNAGIVKEYYYFDGYYKPDEEDFTL